MIRRDATSSTFFILAQDMPLFLEMYAQHDSYGLGATEKAAKQALVHAFLQTPIAKKVKTVGDQNQMTS